MEGLSMGEETLPPTQPYGEEDELMEEPTMYDSNCLAWQMVSEQGLDGLFRRDDDEITDNIVTNHQELINALSEGILMPLMEEEEEGAEGGGQDSDVDEMDEDNDDRKIPWDQTHGEMVTYWHYYIKKSFEILLYTIGVSYPSLLKTICAAAAAGGFSYIDAVFLCCLYSMIGACGGAASTWAGSVGITVGAYTLIRPLVASYMETSTNDQYIRSNAQYCGRALDTGIISNTREAWNRTKGLIPDILKYPGIGIDRASSVLADVMVTRIMSRTYNFGSGGMAQVKIPSHSGGEVDLLDKYGLLNLEILYSDEELRRKKESRLAILSLKTVTGHIFRIIDDERVRILAQQHLDALDGAEDLIAGVTGAEKGQIDEGELVRRTSAAGVEELARQTSNAGVQVNLERTGSGYAALRSKIVNARNELEKMRVINSDMKDELDAEAEAHAQDELDAERKMVRQDENRQRLDDLRSIENDPSALNDPKKIARLGLLQPRNPKQKTGNRDFRLPRSSSKRK